MKQVEKETEKIGLKERDALNLAKWKVHHVGNAGQKLNYYYSSTIDNTKSTSGNYPYRR